MDIIGLKGNFRANNGVSVCLLIIKLLCIWPVGIIASPFRQSRYKSNHLHHPTDTCQGSQRGRHGQDRLQEDLLNRRTNSWSKTE